MNDTRLKTMGATFAARHARNKARQDRDEADAINRYWAVTMTAFAVAFAMLIAIV